MARFSAVLKHFTAFLFDTQDWFSSTAINRMSFAEKGVYFTMLAQEWRDEAQSLPDDPEAVADLIAITADQRAEVIAAWPAVRPKFVTTVTGRLMNVRLERTRREQRARLRHKTAISRRAGLASVKSRQAQPYGKNRKPHALEAQPLEVVEDTSTSLLTDVQRPSTDVQRPSTSVNHIRLDQIRSDQVRSDQSREEKSAASPLVVPAAASSPPPVPDARSKRPIFKGQRVTVFDWQLEDFCRLLGPHTDGFDLHQWFFALDAECVTRGEVPPKRDGGAWLESQLVAEAQRRGLPLKPATGPGPPWNKRIAALVAGGRAFLEQT